MSDWDGNFNVMWTGNEFKILQADPRISITAESIDRFRGGYGHPAITLVGDVLTIRGTNRTVVYRLAEYMLKQNYYRAEWPD
jgi:hypothetical protein